MAEPKFVLDGPENTASYWTTVNASEALPGIVTPLNWSWYENTGEHAQIGVFKSLGVIPVSTIGVPADPDRRFTAVFFGRYVVNVDTWRRYADLAPGMSGDAIEQQFFGSVRPGLKSVKGKIRYGAITAKLPWTMLTAYRKSQRLRAAIDDWAQERLRTLQTADLAATLQMLHQAHRRFAEVQAHHLLCSVIAQMIYQSLTQLAGEAGLAGSHNSLTTGYGLEEAVLQEELWKLSRNEGGSIAAIIEQHGFTGPGEIARPSWREDPSIVQKLIDRFRTLPDDRRPSLVVARQRQERENAEQRLLAALPWQRRGVAKILLKAARNYMPLRESGRAALLVALDVGRAAVNRIGATLVAQNILRQADDIFFLDLQEIDAAAGPAGLPGAQALVDARRERRTYYETLSLPTAWVGTPVPEILHAEVNTGAVIQGVPVTNASVTAKVRVVTDPAEADEFEEGEILVCKLTDPSWASLFMVAAGVVIDIGGPLSHGAIVARELGLPCIINTKNGTTQLVTGMTVELDGASGIVTILAAPDATPERYPVATEL